MAMQNLPRHVQQLITLYRNAQQDLINTIAYKDAKGNVTWYQKSLLEQVNAQLAELDKQAEQWVGTNIPKDYEKGIKATNDYLNNLGLDIPSGKAFSSLHKDAIELIAQNAFDDLHDANLFVGRRLKDATRQAGIDAVAKKLTTGQTVRECKKNLINSLIKEGISGIKDKKGRMISLDAYAESVARSTTREATNQASINQLTELNYDLVKISSHNTTCPICAPLQGRVYSISGKDPRFPPLTIAHSGGYANIHVNCRHVVLPFIEELADDLEEMVKYSNRPFDIDSKSKASIDRYNKVQKQKRQMRADRHQWQRYKLVLPNDTPKTFSGFRRMKKANSERWQELQKDYRKVMKVHDDSGIIKETASEKLSRILKGANTKDRKMLAEQLLKNFGNDHISLHIDDISQWGYCRLENIYDSKRIITWTEMHLKKSDLRSIEYQTKTLFHEFFHSASDGLEHDFHKVGGLKGWAKIDDLFAECSAHYMNYKIGITKELAPSYPEYLAHNLPKLKKHPEFKNCKSIVDFGEKMAEYRFSDSKRTAKWETIHNFLQNESIDFKDYCKDYKKYVFNNVDGIVDKALENMPAYKQYKPQMINDVKSAWNKVLAGKHSQLTSNEDLMFDNSLIITMNRKGVK